MSSMLLQSGASLFKATSTTMIPSQVARRALSTGSKFHRPLAKATPHLHRQLRTLRTSHCLPTQPSRPSLFHTSTLSYSPATSSSSEESNQPTPTSSTLEKPDFLNEAESSVWDLLVKEFNPVELVVQDISGGCGSMYGIEISSEKFRGANMLKQQRMVNAVLGDLLKGWHGCQLKTRVP